MSNHPSIQAGEPKKKSWKRKALRVAWNVVSSRKFLGPLAFVTAFDLAVQEGTWGASALDSVFATGLANQYCNAADHVPNMVVGFFQFSFQQFDQEARRNGFDAPNWFGSNYIYDSRNFCSRLSR